MKRLERHWQRVDRLHLLLWPASMLFRALVALRRFCYRVRMLPTVTLPVPVIVIGNIAVGGTGKTPLALWLAQLLRVNQFRPGILTRGYGGSMREPHAVIDTADPQFSGDEPVLLAARSRCPVWAGADRVAAARALLETNPLCDILICDDGMQHYALGRDIEIAVVDVARGYGNGFMQPAGPLREPRARLKSVDALVLNGDRTAGVFEDAAPGRIFSMRLEGDVFHNLFEPDQRVLAPYFHAKKLHAIAGIGNPERFFAHLRKLGLAFTAHAFADHHPYSARDLDFAGCDALVMTEKDAVKCARFATGDCWVLPVDAIVDEELGALILDKLGGD